MRLRYSQVQSIFEFDWCLPARVFGLAEPHHNGLRRHSDVLMRGFFEAL